VAVGLLHRHQHAVLVPVEAGAGPGRIDVLDHVAVGTAAQLLAMPGRVDHGQHAAGRRALHPPPGAVGRAAAHHQPGGVALDLEPVAQRRGGGDQLAGGVPLVGQDVAVAVGHRHHPALVVVVEAQHHPVGVDHPADQTVDHVQAGDRALRVLDGGGRAVVARVTEAAGGVAGAGGGDAAVPVVPVEGHGGAVRPLDAPAAPGPVPAVRRGAAAPVDDLGQVAVVVVDGGGGVAQPVDHLHQLRVLVVHEAVDRTAPVVAHVGDQVGAVAELHPPARRGELGGDPAGAVVGVADRRHAVGVDCGLEPAGGIPGVAAEPQGTVHRHQPAAVVVRVVDPAAVVGHRGHDPLAGPLQPERTAPLVGQPHQPLALPAQHHPPAGPGVDLDRPALGVEPPAQVLEREAGHQPHLVLVPLALPLAADVGGLDAAGEAGHGAPGQGHLGHLAVEAAQVGHPAPRVAPRVAPQPGRGPRRPAGTEGADGGVEAVVGPAQLQPAQRRPEPQVDLDVEEVAGGGADRVVGVTGGGGPAHGGRRGDHQVGPELREAGPAQGQRDLGVGGVAEGGAPGVGVAERLGHGAQPAAVRAVGRHPRRDGPHQAVGVERAPAVVEHEVAERRRQPRLGGEQLPVDPVVGGGALVEVGGTGRDDHVRTAR
jgi:hypothetical protein